MWNQIKNLFLSLLINLSPLKFKKNKIFRSLILTFKFSLKFTENGKINETSQCRSQGRLGTTKWSKGRHKRLKRSRIRLVFSRNPPPGIIYSQCPIFHPKSTGTIILPRIPCQNSILLLKSQFKTFPLKIRTKNRNLRSKVKISIFNPSTTSTSAKPPHIFLINP
jgi:hypothetical protein